MAEIDRGGVHVLLREIDEPHDTDALIYYRGRSKITVGSNELSRIGALAYIDMADTKKGADQPGKRFPHHERTAQEFRNLYERVYGGSGAVDPSREPVDTSPVAHDSGMAARADLGRKIKAAEVYLGKEPMNEIIALVVFQIPAGSAADIMPSGQRNQRQVREAIAGKLAVLDRLATHWGYRSR